MHYHIITDKHGNRLISQIFNGFNEAWAWAEANFTKEQLSNIYITPISKEQL